MCILCEPPIELEDGTVVSHEEFLKLIETQEIEAQEVKE